MQGKGEKSMYNRSLEWAKLEDKYFGLELLVHVLVGGRIREIDKE